MAMTDREKARPVPRPGGKALELTVRDILDNLEEFALISGQCPTLPDYQIIDDVEAAKPCTARSKPNILPYPPTADTKVKP